MPNINGQIISGEFDTTANEFLLQKIKNQTTTSVIKERQFLRLYRYLQEHQDSAENQVITLYDQMLIPLTRDEIKALLADLEKIQPMYH
ncbi:hypothetical protein N0O92_13975 [Alkalihalobacillus sp. MEB130]|uniref:hypothetical protein n=1 Tax=Alkalihalobacillus sp. MEB130 TaxID=2976704 RepID=UPI0028DD634A|nr:hypothetical protein [Alkalihalobacillus sp. MEB130]MDT8861343.1 hypothetical protein [Alkalihalobacillus sp. MEB130]